MIVVMVYVSLGRLISRDCREMAMRHRMKTTKPSANDMIESWNLYTQVCDNKACVNKIS